MINFSTLKGLTIPEGVVTQIADASGRVLWSKSRTATITISNTGNRGSCNISHNGTIYYTPTTFTANIGDTISCGAENSEKNRVYVNNVLVASGDSYVDYDYTVVSDATVRFNYDNPDKTYIYITET